MDKISKIILHFILICIVVLLPVIIYNIMSKKGYHDFAFVGGLTYFFYVLYWILKIKRPIIKIIVWSIFRFLSIMIIGMSFLFIDFEWILPITLLLNLTGYLFLLIKNPKSTDKKVWRAYLCSFVFTFIVSLLGILFWLYAIAMSRMPAMRY